MAFEALEVRGVKVAVATRAEGGALTVANVTIQLGEGLATDYAFTLPRAPAPQFVFTRESFRSSFSKLLWPEVQLGDPEFDDLVVARTTTEEATRAFLHDTEARGFVLDLLAEGGAITVDGAEVHVRVPESARVVDEAAVAAFVERLVR